MFLKIFFWTFFFVIAWCPSFYAQEFINQNTPPPQFAETIEKIQKSLAKFSKNGLRLPAPLSFKVTTSDLLIQWEEESSGILIHAHDEEWLIERKITQATLPIFEDKNYRIELAGVSIEEFLQQKKRIETAVKSWRRAGASLKPPVPIRLTSDINFHTIHQKVIWISISLEDDESIERVLSLFFNFSFKLPAFSLQAQGISVNEFKQARMRVKELRTRSKKEEKKIPSLMVAQHALHPFFYRTDRLVFPWNAPLDLLEKNIQATGGQKSKKDPMQEAPVSIEKPLALTVPLSSEKGSIPSKKLPEKAVQKEKEVRILSTKVLNDLMHKLYQPDQSLQLDAIQEFAVYGEQSAVMVPNLLGFLRSSSQEIQLATIQTMGTIGPSAILAVPVLLLCLDDPSPIIRENTALALGSMLALESLPFLKLSLKREKEESVQKALKIAIQQIQSTLIPTKNF